MIGGLIALLVIAAAGYQLLIGSRLKVESTRVSRGAVTDWYTESGTIRSGDSVEIVSKVNGDVREVLVAENSVVQKGDVLLRIDSRAYEYSKEQAEKNIEMLQAELSQSDVLGSRRGQCSASEGDDGFYGGAVPLRKW